MSGYSEVVKCFQNKDIAARDAENWVVRGRERPRPAGLPRRLTPRWSLPPTYYQRLKPVPERY
jgi:hypothetical protein